MANTRAKRLHDIVALIALCATCWLAMPATAAHAATNPKQRVTQPAKKPEVKKQEAKKPEAKKPEAKKLEARKPEAKSANTAPAKPAREAAGKKAAPKKTAHGKGKPRGNSVTGEEERLEVVLPLVARYKAAVIGVANDESGISYDQIGRAHV